MIASKAMWHNISLPNIKERIRKQIKNFVETNGKDNLLEQIGEFARDMCEIAREKINDVSSKL